MNLRIIKLSYPGPKDNIMIITTRNGRSFNTDTDLTAEERHILQKLIIWKSMASSVDQFRQKREEAILKGWNNSGPVQESEALKAIIADMEEQVILRLREMNQS
jgi:hypothetical protein